MAQEIELCVFRGGKWEIFNFYAKRDLDRAVEEAISLKSQNAFKKIAVLEDSTGKMHYFHSDEGNKLGFDQIKKGLKLAAEQGARPSRPVKKIRGEATAKANPTKNRKSARASTPKKEEVKNNPMAMPVAAGGVLIGLFIMLSTGFSLSSIFMGIAFGGACLYYSYLLQTEPVPENKDEKNQPQHNQVNVEEDPAYVTPEHLNEVAKIFEEMIIKGKAQGWDESENKMRGDCHFGLILFTIGALYSIAGKDNKTPAAYYKVLSSAFKNVNLDEESVLRCTSNIEEFRLNPRYAAMFEKGYTNTQGRLDNPENPLGVTQALKTWEASESEENGEQATSAVLFTDIVSFTQQTVEKGEEWMKDTVHAHNQIVRDILAQYKGKEVKHTGDGIMAAFPSTVQALNAAVRMQKGFKYFSEAKPSSSFAVRIGIASGNPVQMDGDLFGTPVNMAARVMPFGDDLEITVSQSVYDTCEPDETCHHKFIEQPDVELKGFKGTHSVYKVDWQGKEEG